MEDGRPDPRGRFATREVVREYWPDGRVKSERGVREDGTEAWTYWYPDGTVQQELVPGEVSGTVTMRRHRSDGSLRSTIEYREGRKHGSWREFRSDGSLKSERRYEDGRLLA